MLFEYAPIVCFDLSLQVKNFGLPPYVNWILPDHKYLAMSTSVIRTGQLKFVYHNNQSTGEQWSDYQGGLIVGWKITKTLGIFVEGEYTKFWILKYTIVKDLI